jgi:hypothetical protein
VWSPGRTSQSVFQIEIETELFWGRKGLVRQVLMGQPGAFHKRGLG